MDLIRGRVFDTQYESNCVAVTFPDLWGNFTGIDSNGQLADYNTAMVTKLHEPHKEL